MVKSKSEEFFNKRAGRAPLISSLAANSVSRERKAMLAEEVEKGNYREGNSDMDKTGGLTPASYATAHVGSTKIAQVVSSGGGYRGGFGDSVKQAPDVYSPLWLNSNLNLPRDRATINAWCRSFYVLNPFVHNAINLHSTYPISKLNIKCKNKEVERFFNDMIEELDLMNICVQIAQEFWLLGEAFVYAEYDERNGKWSRLLLQNPDYMIVQKTVVSNEPTIMLRPDQNLQKIVNSNKPADIEQRKQLNQYIVDSVKRGQNIPLDNWNVSHIARKVSPYESRGTGLPVAIFRQLMLFDKLRESKFAQADNMINPLTIVKIGGPDFRPQPQDLDAWRDIFASAQNDKDFKIFTHEAIDIVRSSAGQSVLDINPDITQLIKEIYVGLQVPQVLMDGGADTTYANGGVALDVLRQRYMQFRNMMSAWLKRKIFAPISKIRGFEDTINGKKHLIVPEIDWNHMSLFDAGDYIDKLVSLSVPSGEGVPPRVSNETLYRSLGLEAEDENRKIRKQTVQNVIYVKEKEALTAMNLNELRSLTDDSEINEVDPVPGQTPTDGGEPGGGDAGLGSPLPGELSGGGSSPPPPPSAIPEPPPT